MAALVVGVVVFAAASHDVEGSGAPARERKTDLLILSGGGAGGDAAHGYLGVIFPLNGNAGGQGFVARGWAKTFTFKYKATIGGVAATTVNATGLGFTGEIGHRWMLGDAGHVALYGGVRYRKFQLTPNDPGSDLNHGKIGASAALDVRWLLNGPYAVDANASYTAGYDEYWLQFKPHVRLGNGIRLGPDLVVQGGDEYRYLRLGLFASGITVKWPSLGRLFLSLEAGLQHDAKDGGDTVHGGVHTAFFF